MGLIREPKNIDLSKKSEPWTEVELADFRKIMESMRAKNPKLKSQEISTTSNAKRVE